MQKNATTGKIVYMEPGEIAIYDLYKKEGVTRDDLPYTANFDRIVSGYNAATCSTATPHEVWRALCKVLKQGQDAIAEFLGR